MYLIGTWRKDVHVISAVCLATRKHSMGLLKHKVRQVRRTPIYMCVSKGFQIACPLTTNWWRITHFGRKWLIISMVSHRLVFLAPRESVLGVRRRTYLRLRSTKVRFGNQNGTFCVLLPAFARIVMQNTAPVSSFKKY